MEIWSSDLDLIVRVKNGKESSGGSMTGSGQNRWGTTKRNSLDVVKQLEWHHVVCFMKRYVMRVFVRCVFLF